jgi:hypothetical protein
MQHSTGKKGKFFLYPNLLFNSSTWPFLDRDITYEHEFARNYLFYSVLILAGCIQIMQRKLRIQFKANIKTRHE